MATVELKVVLTELVPGDAELVADFVSDLLMDESRHLVRSIVTVKDGEVVKEVRP